MDSAMVTEREQIRYQHQRDGEVGLAAKTQEKYTERIELGRKALNAGKTRILGIS
jgi:hypothetical protein